MSLAVCFSNSVVVTSSLKSEPYLTDYTFYVVVNTGIVEDTASFSPHPLVAHVDSAQVCDHVNS